ncbi:PrsW family intramembrane metalloprotease [Treponema phagedenis]|uniref:PrsW family intramembrane metalloprotease n=1 Tax=Treponema phagedenis TaxID=162 RepID=A0A0B7GYW8_TREPH|nr:PrsW family glutamic-type intramembrane protease [Treponema phagedenis]EFW37240.1 hypothetical protein HMPREF9554_02250 [Treponema phagedenis F0421]NVP24947.1 PrsW family intramembrane metalloprotease [Treponema phagedenis]QEJ94417.1 PrsW family intramembrane metalloprotease [Treponema phagedenis]QEJ96660.1 PrsW family intramembrane metalloprotease [Treponema phagedenis]QEK01703.1 PrsW family intramembrane metalloprotease [Treponema phagedenis]
MIIAAVILFSFLPALLWAFFTGAKKNIAPLPLFLSFTFAFCALVVVLFLQWLLGFDSKGFQAPLSLLYVSFIQAALIEEGVKLIFFLFLFKLLSSAKREKFEDSLPAQQRVSIFQTLILAVFFGFSFGGLETIGYGVIFPNFVLVRALTAVLLHGGLSVFYLRIAIVKNKMKQVLFFLIPFLLHGLYNFFIIIGSFFFIFSVLIIIFLLQKVFYYLSEYQEV